MCIRDRIYRDDAYVVRETVALAAQLRAIAEGDAAPQRDDSRRRSASIPVAEVAVADFDRHAGELPWGWWLRANPRGYEDAAGRNWASVRDAFWEGELGFPPVHFAPEQHELMLRVMTAIDARWFGTEGKQDVFGGDMMLWRFCQCWLASIGMGENSNGRDFLDGGLTSLGKSVLMMARRARAPLG